MPIHNPTRSSSGRIFDDRGNRLTPSYAVKKGLRYRYYVSSVLAQGRREETGSVARVAASDVETIVVAALRAHDSDPDSTDRDLIQRSLERVTIHTDQVEIVRVGDDQNPIRSDWSPAASGASAS